MRRAPAAGSSETSSAAHTWSAALDTQPAAPASETLRLHSATSFRDTCCGSSRTLIWMLHCAGCKELPQPGSLTTLPRGRNAPGDGGQGPGGPRQPWALGWPGTVRPHLQTSVHGSWLPQMFPAQCCLRIGRGKETAERADDAASDPGEAPTRLNHHLTHPEATISTD